MVIMVNIGQLWDFWVFNLHQCQQVADMRFLSEVNLGALSWQTNAEKLAAPLQFYELSSCQSFGWFPYVSLLWLEDP